MFSLPGSSRITSRKISHKLQKTEQRKKQINQEHVTKQEYATKQEKGEGERQLHTATVSATSSGYPSRPIGISIFCVSQGLSNGYKLHALFASSSDLPGSIVVSWISAGATPLTVMPVLE
jgi:uncharacterized membrane protein YdbT with pleckstrin-like domain